MPKSASGKHIQSEQSKIIRKLIGEEQLVLSVDLTEKSTVGTHMLKLTIGRSGVKYSSLEQQLTFWRAKDRQCEQDLNTAHNGSHSPTGESTIGIVSRDQIQLTTEATHFLDSQGQPL